jgi:lipopolysaccharide biosynthesis regulator YciM
LAHASVDEIAARFAANPGDRVAFEALEEAHFVAGRWPALVTLYTQRLAAPDLAAGKQPQARARLLLRLAQVLEERCERLDDAVARYQEALRLEPSLRGALTQLRRIHARRDAWDLALQVAELEGALPMRPFERAAFATEIGELWLRRLSDPAQAIVSFEQACEADPHHAPALLGLASAHEALGQVAETASALGRAVDVLKGAERARALVRLARLCEGPLANPRRALELYRRAFTEDPRNVEALDALALHAEAHQQWELLEDLHERRFALEPDPIRKLAIAHDAGRTQLERLRNPQGARHWFRRAHELFPDDPMVHLHLADAARLSGHTEELAMHLRRAATLAAEATPPEVLRESAKLASAAGDHDRAVLDLERAAQKHPHRADLLQELASALWRAGRHAGLVGLLERSIEQATPGSAEEAALWLALANAHEEGTGDLDAALAAFERAAATVPGDARVVAGVERLLRKTEGWEALREHLLRSAQAVEPARAAAVHCVRGALEIEHFEDLDAARACFENALAVDADCVEARQGLERIALALGDDDAILEAFQREAATTSDRGRLAFLVGELARIHEERGEPERALAWGERLVAAAPEDVAALSALARLQELLGRSDELVATLGKLDLRVDGAERAALRRRLGALHRARGEPEAALGAYRAALAAQPDDIDSARACVALLAAGGSAAERIEAQRRLADLAGGRERAEALHALGGLLGEAGDLAAAVACFEAIAGDPGAPPDSGDRLLQGLEALGRYDVLCARLEAKRAALDPLAPEAFALDLRRAELLLDRLERPDAAIPLFDAVREALPDDARARTGLERALRRTGSASRLSELLAENARRERDAGRRSELELERARLLEEQLRALPEARAVLSELADGSGPVADEAEGRLLSLLERERDFPALAATLESRLGRGSPAHDAELRRRLAFVCRDRLHDSEAAAAHLEAAASLEPGRADVLQGLALLYQELDRPDDLARALEAELAADPEPGRARLLHHRLAELAVGRLADPERAERHWKALLALDPSSVPAVEYLVRRFESEERHADLAEVLRGRLAALGDDPPAATSLRLRIAGLEAGPLADPESALVTLAPAAQDEATLPVVAEPLADLYLRLGRHEELVALARRAAAASALPAERAAWRLRIADALRSAGDRAGAAEAVRQALADRPDDASAQSLLRDLYRQLGEAAPLALLLEAQLARAVGAAEVPLRLELATLLDGPLARPAGALPHLHRVLEIAPGHAEALARALALAEQLGAPAELEVLLAEATRRAPTAAERAALRTRRGRLLAGPLARPEEAIACFEEALHEDPRAGAALAALREALAARGDFRGVLDCDERRLARLGLDAGARRIALLRDAARLAAERIGGEAALPWLERLRHALPEDVAVLEQLSALHRAAGRHGPLRETLEARLALGATGRARAALQLERADLLDRQLGAPGRAAEALEDALAAAPGEVAVLAALDALYAREGRARERLRVLETRIALAGAGERAHLHRVAAQLARSLGRGEDAARHLEAALAEPGSTPIERIEGLRELAGVWRALGRSDREVEVGERELALLDPEAPVFAERRRALRFELARLCSEPLGHVDAAVGHLRALLDREQEAGERLEQAETLLLALLRQSDDAVELERRLAARLARRADPADAAGWLELARLRRERLRRPAAAADAYRELLARVPDELEGLRGLRACAELLGDFEEVADTLERELALRPEVSASERSALLRRLGSVAWNELDATPRARSAFAAALDADPADLVSLRSLQSLCEGMEDWRSAVELYEREVEVLGEREPGRRRSAWLRAAELARERLRQLARARAAYASADAIEPLAPAQLAEWAQVHERLGQKEPFTKIFGRWMDTPGAAVGAQDRLRLSDALAALGKKPEALARAEQAAAEEPHSGEAWDRVAALREALGRNEAAAEALLRSADCTGGREAAVRRLGAAELVLAEDPERAAAWLAEAVADDPALPACHARLAVASAGLGRLAEAERAALRALSLPEDDADPLTPALRLETALVGARAARAQDHLEAAAELFGAVLTQDPEQAEALASIGELRLALGDAEGARDALVRRLALDADDAERGLLLCRLAEAEEKLGELETALARYHESLARDGTRDAAHAGLARLLAREGRHAEAVAALEAWAALASGPEARAARLLQAAEIALGHGGTERAERLLCDALEAWPQAPGGWGMLAELLASQGRGVDVIELAPAALAQAQSSGERARVALAAGRALEQRGAPREAAEHYSIACRADPRGGEAALGAARLLRGLGEWRAAADVLAEFLAAAPPDAGPLTAPVHHQLGRLLAGPLESLEAGLEAYRAALAADPQLSEAREALADLLVHRPALWEEAIERHRELLAANPLRVASLRALLRIARARGHDLAVAAALSLLRALGLASADERREAAARFPLPLERKPRFADPVWETARALAQEAAEEIGQALGVGAAAPVSDPRGLLDPVARFRAEVTAAEAELSAAGLVPLSVAELGETLTLVAQLTAEADAVSGDGHVVNALAEALGRRARKRLKRVLGAAPAPAIAALDFAAWRAELRGLASLATLARSPFELRTAFLAWVAADDPKSARALAPDANLCERVAGSPEARALLRHLLDAWIPHV